jgi:hypothetical protein
MADDTVLMELEPTPAVVLGRTVVASRLSRAVDGGLARVRGAVTAARVPTSGVPFVRFLERGDPLQIEIGQPLSGPHQVPSLRSSLLPGGTAICTWYQGGIPGVPAALERLGDRLGDEAVPTGSPWMRLWPDGGTERLQLVWPVSRP